jgi:hypothetical protein
MKRRLTLRRWFMVGGLGLLVGWEPGRVMLHVVNASHEDVQVRRAGDETWTPAKIGADVLVATLLHHGLCNAPDRWLPEDFSGLEFKRADGSVVTVSREAFEAEAEYEHRWIYRFRG